MSIEEKKLIEKPRLFGEFQVVEQVGETELTILWKALQTSVDRVVILEELRVKSMKKQTDFMGDIRAKASLEHPMLSTIYEASVENGQCWVAHERLSGRNLQDFLDAKEVLPTVGLVQAMNRISRAYMHYEERQMSTLPLTLEDIYFEPNGAVVQLRNLAIAGERGKEETQRDIEFLGNKLKKLLNLKKPGGGRCQHLLSWMRGEGEDKVSTWTQLQGYCETIEQQLSEKAMSSIPHTAAIRRRRKQRGFGWVFAIVITATAAVTYLIFG